MTLHRPRPRAATRQAGAWLRVAALAERAAAGLRRDVHLRGVPREGTRTLSDAAFLMRPNLHARDDPLRHGKGLIDDWVGKAFAQRRRG